MIDKAPPPPEFSRPFDTAEMGEHPEHRAIEASSDECRALAARLGTLGIERLDAELTITRLRPGLFRLEGRLAATVRQQCVVTLEPVENTVEERFAITYVSASGDEADAVLRDDGEEGPESLDGAVVDFGEAVSQQLAIALDPYPRAPGASLEKILPPDVSAPEAPAGPFAALAALRKRMG